ncbi:hypothetical protein ACV229_34240 [Burkholderia sp. MR1-5-21]
MSQAWLLGMLRPVGSARARTSDNARALILAELREQSNGVQVQVRVKLPSGPLIELTNFCKAIAEALRPTAARHFEGIECIVAKMQKFHRPMVQPDDNDERLALGQSQAAPQVKGNDEPSQPHQERRDAEKQGALEVPHESDLQQQVVELSEAPYPLTEDERRVLNRILPSLPPLRYPIADDDKAAFLNVWSGLSDRPAWEPILMSAADLERYKMEQGQIQIRHQRALRDEFARRRLTAVDAGHAPLVTLAPGGFILRESAIAYLNRCGLVSDDGDLDADNRGALGVGGLLLLCFPTFALPCPFGELSDRRLNAPEAMDRPLTPDSRSRVAAE